jgi:VanZ family protein
VLNQKTIFFLALGWTLLIVFLSLVSMSSLKDPLDVPFKDKAVHFVFYFVFVLLWDLWKYKSTLYKSSWILLPIALLFGILIEFSQGYFTNDRKFELFDIMANSLGAIFGFISSKKIIKTFKSHL